MLNVITLPADDIPAITATKTKIDMFLVVDKRLQYKNNANAEIKCKPMAMDKRTTNVDDGPLLFTIVSFFRIK